jgi:hypothetical protein
MKKTIRTIASSSAITLLLFSGTTLMKAQSNNATLTGTVADKTGAVIPEARIVVIEEASGVTRSTTSDQRGFFSLVGVPVSTYDVEISAPGFNSLRRKGIAVHINDQIELKGIVLTVAGTSISVMVTATATEMTPTTSGEVSYTISDTQLHNMNLESRSAIELLGLVPGSGNTGNWNSAAYNGNQAGFTQNASAFTVNGNRFDQVQLVSDGASVTDLNTAGGASVTPNVDMIAELKVESAAYSAAQPNGPIVVTTETKAGGRDFHGEAYMSVRDHSMDTTDWQNLTNGLPKSQTSLFYPGVNVGGPVLMPGVSRDHEKLFFFAATEIAQQHVDQGVRKAAVPTSAMRSGDFSNVWDMDLSNAANGYEYWPVSTYPCGGNPLPSYCSGSGKVIPSAAGQILLSAFPLPNVDPLAHTGNNLITDFTTSDPRNQEILRMDWAVNDNFHIFGRFNHENESVPWPYGPYNQWNQVPYPAYQTGKDASNSWNGTMTNVLSSSLTNEGSLGYTRFTLKQALSNLSAVSRTALDYPYANLFTSSSDLIPNVEFEGGNTAIANEQLYIAGGEAPPYLGAQNNFTVNDSLTKLRGKHMFKVGFFGQFGRYNLLTTGNDNGSVATESYTGVTGNDWADLLLGYVSGFTQSSSNIKADMEEKRFDFFAQDTWKTTSKLTLNYGLRVDHIGSWFDRGGRIAIFNPSAYVATATPNYSSYTGIQTHATTPSVPLSGSKPLGFQWAPSVGFAYDFSGSGKTVVRGGFGTNYYIDPGTNSFSAIEAPPNFKVATLWASSGSPYTLSGLSTLNFTNVVPTVWGTANPSDHRAPLTYSWNLAVSQAFPWSSKIEANYVGNVSRNLVGYGKQNVVPEGSEKGPWYGTWYDDYQTPYLRPYPDYGDISTLYHNLNSNYNALQLTVTRQKGWLNYWASYTFGKSLAYNAEDAFDMKRWYGPTPFDRSQILSFSYYLTLPSIGRQHMGNHALVNGVVDGWHVSGIFQAMPGGPIGNNFGSEYAANRNTIGIWGIVSTTVDGQTNSNISLSSNGGSFADGTPDEIAVPKMICDPRKGLAKNQYFNNTCLVAPSYLENGTYRLPYIHGPAFINDSTGIFKTFGMGGSRKLEIRGEVFNLFNHPWNEFLASDSQMYLGFSAAGGTDTALTPTAGTADNKTGHRQIQLAAKYYF